MDNAIIKELFENQRISFNNNETLDYNERRKRLLNLYNLVKNNVEQISEALYLDLNKSKEEAYMTEIGLLLEEISFQLKHLKSYMKDIKYKTPLSLFGSKSFTHYVPYGNVLIIAPWNYPFLLAMSPLVDALAAGNNVIIKPSEIASNTSKILAKLADEYNNKLAFCVIEGDVSTVNYLLSLDFKYVFFTGGGKIGSIIASNLAPRLIPYTLELGGKSPVIVTKNANIKLAARRIVFGKIINCGQTCVAPDYILCDSTIKEELLQNIKAEIIKQLGNNPLENRNYGKIINANHYNRLKGLLNDGEIYYGGEFNDEIQKIAPTIIDNPKMSSNLMSNEIFGPILPIITYSNLHEVINKMKNQASPLALYLFTDNKNEMKQIEPLLFGGGAINDTITHLCNNNFGFGGVMQSGIGSYHGRFGFETFSHKKSMIKNSTLIDLDLKYNPITEGKFKLIKKFLK